MATKKKSSSYSKGAKELLLKADKILSRKDGKSNTMLFDNRARNAEKAGVSTAFGFFGGPSEHSRLEKAISKVKRKKK